MKASDYAVRFRAEGCTVEALARVVKDMMIEVRSLGLQRRIRNDDGLFSILDEMNLKFESFFRQTGGRLSDGSLMHIGAFKRMLRHQMPDIFSPWNMHRGGKLLTD
jgi:hypothetical protein